MENLAPAGNREALERAIAAGADAVYLGCTAFSARAGAGNFDGEGLREAVRLAHLHHVRVHVTVNTLIKDNELADVYQLVKDLNETQVDAVLVQDLGVLQLCRTCFPELTVHASTQMAIHNATGAAWCRSLGISRVVLARECSVQEMAKAAQTGIEVEAFGHGAQCVGVSGECLFSSMLGERSGNRGRCAQPCRLLYTYRGAKGAWLSPRDVCMRNHLPELAAAGVCSVKLEGRLKRPEYVAQVAGSYRKGIDSLEHGFTPADEAEMRDLRQIFQRGGFMKGYAVGSEDAGVICPERVSHSGVSMGSVRQVKGNLAELYPVLPLHDGDQLQIRGRHADYEMIYSGSEIPAGEKAMLRLRPDAQIRPGDEAFRLTDAAQLDRMNLIPLPRIPVDAELIAFPGKPLTLTLTDGSSCVTVVGDVVSEAKNRAMTAEDASKNIDRMGDTCFVLQNLTVSTEGAFVPASVLNALRREATESLTEERIRAFAPKRSEVRKPQVPVLNESTVNHCRILRNMDDRAGDALNIWYPEDWREEALRATLNSMPAGDWLLLPTVCEEQTLQEISRITAEYSEKLGGVVLGSVGQLGISWSVPFAAGTGIPVMNRRAAEFLLNAGCSFVTASPELSAQELKTLMVGKPAIVVPALGRTRLMLLHHCPARTALGLQKGHRNCTMCDTGSPDALLGQVLTDRMGYDFPLRRLRLPEGCLVELMNARVTDVTEQVGRADYPMLLDMTCADGAKTVGHWNRPVE